VLILLLLFLLFPNSVFATEPIIKITNYSSNSSPEWVEINNQTDNIVDINNWVIRDANRSLTDDLIITGCLSPHSYITFYHDSGWLNNSSAETISLYDIDNNLIDQLTYTKGQLNLNPRSDNTCVPIPTSSPTPTPTPISISLPTITPSLTPIPTNIPKPTNTPIPTLTPSPTIKPTATPTTNLNRYSSSDESTISAILEPTEIIKTINKEKIKNTPPSNNGSVLGETITTKKNFIPLFFICLGGLFLLAPLIIAKIKNKDQCLKK
jgi:Lamin Tail Domain